MPSVQQAIVVNATPERVWTWLAAPRFYGVWMDGVAAVPAVSTVEMGPGTTFTIIREQRHAEEAWIVAEWDLLRRMRLTAYRTDRQLIFQLEAAPDGTHLVIEQAWPASRGILSRLVPPRSQQRGLERTVSRLRAVFALNQDIKLLHGMGDE